MHKHCFRLLASNGVAVVRALAQSPQVRLRRGRIEENPGNGVGPRGDFLVFAIYTLSNFTINTVNISRLVKLAKCVILKVNCVVQLGYFSLSSDLLLFLIS